MKKKKINKEHTFEFIVSQRSLEVFFNLGRCVAPIMRKYHAISVYVLGSALAVVRIVRSRTSRTYRCRKKLLNSYTSTFSQWIDSMKTARIRLKMTLETSNQ